MMIWNPPSWKVRRITVDLFPFLSVNGMTKDFYYSILKDKKNQEEKKIVEALIDIPVFIRNFSIFSGFVIINDKSVHRKNRVKDVVLVMPFFEKFVSRQKIMEKLAKMDDCERIIKE
ncbi:hypothetical protein Tco_0293549 [Tanacetum coccineum]